MLFIASAATSLSVLPREERKPVPYQNETISDYWDFSVSILLFMRRDESNPNAFGLTVLTPRLEIFNYLTISVIIVY